MCVCVTPLFHSMDARKVRYRQHGIFRMYLVPYLCCMMIDFRLRHKHETQAPHTHNTHTHTQKHADTTYIKKRYLLLLLPHSSSIPFPVPLMIPSINQYIDRPPPTFRVLLSFASTFAPAPNNSLHPSVHPFCEQKWRGVKPSCASAMQSALEKTNRGERSSEQHAR